MKTLYFSSVGGASGDMILGTLIGLGVPAEKLQTDLRALLPNENFTVTAQPVTEHGFSGIRAKVTILEPGRAHHHHEGHDEHEHAHPHRRLDDIAAIIAGGNLPEAVKTMALQVFRRLAEAEAKIHGTTPDQIHFHEVGAVDSIADIVGCCLGRHLLGVESVHCGPLPQGTGTTTCMHGIIPIPAPATVELLKGMEIIHTEEPFELVTPTGAALLAEWCGGITNAPERGRIVNAAYGFGQRALQGRVNLLRAELLESAVAVGSDECLVLECNIDDCNPEILAAAFGKLLNAGALDVFAQPLLMKKQRLGQLLSVICENATAAALEEIIFRETTTFGIRRYRCERTRLDRRTCEVQVAGCPVRIKIGSRDGRDLTASPEYEDCVRAAETSGLPLKEVYRLARLAEPEVRG